MPYGSNSSSGNGTAVTNTKALNLSNLEFDGIKKNIKDFKKTKCAKKKNS